jgi:hypothetical protein
VRDLDAILVRFYRGLFDLARTPSVPLLDEVLALLAEITNADLVHVEIGVRSPSLRRAWSRSARAEEPGVDSKTDCVLPIVLGLPVGFVRIRHSSGAVDDIACEAVQALAQQLALVAERFTHDFSPRDLKSEVRLIQRRRVLDAVEGHKGNVTAAARELGVSRTFVSQVVRRAKRS